MSKEETMVERCVEALQEAHRTRTGRDTSPGITPFSGRDAKRLVVAVIDALMEPSDELLEAAGLDNDNSGAPFVSNFNYFRDQLRAMLSKAKEGTGE